MADERVHFNNLPEATRTNLAIFVKTKRATMQELRKSQSTGVIAVSIFSIVVAAAAWFILKKGYGDLASFRLAPIKIPLICMGLAFPFAVIGAGLGSIPVRPIPAGTYVAPTQIIDATSNVLRITPLAGATVEVTHLIDRDAVLMRDIGSNVRIETKDGSMTFRFPSKAAALGAAGIVTRNIEKCETDPTWAEREDLFAAARNQPWTTRATTTPTAGPRFSRLHWFASNATWLAFLLGVALGPVVWWARNQLSDAAAFKKIRYESEAILYQINDGNRAAEVEAMRPNLAK